MKNNNIKIITGTSLKISNISYDQLKNSYPIHPFILPYLNSPTKKLKIEKKL